MVPRPHNDRCLGQFKCTLNWDGAGGKLNQPIKLCGHCGLLSQRTPHSSNVPFYMYSALSMGQVRGLGDKQVLAYGSLQAMIAKSHMPVHVSISTEWCVAVQQLVHVD